MSCGKAENKSERNWLLHSHSTQPYSFCWPVNISSRNAKRANAADNPRASTTTMRELLPASRVQPLVMTAPKRRHETLESRGGAFRRHNVGVQRRAQRVRCNDGLGAGARA
jgi:hypothetical protein